MPTRITLRVPPPSPDDRREGPSRAPADVELGEGGGGDVSDRIRRRLSLPSTPRRGGRKRMRKRDGGEGGEDDRDDDGNRQSLLGSITQRRASTTINRRRQSLPPPPPRRPSDISRHLREHLSSTDISASPRLVGYVYMAMAGLVCAVSAAMFQRNMMPGIELYGDTRRSGSGRRYLVVDRSRTWRRRRREAATWSASATWEVTDMATDALAQGVLDEAAEVGGRRRRNRRLQESATEPPTGNMSASATNSTVGPSPTVAPLVADNIFNDANASNTTTLPPSRNPSVAPSSDPSTTPSPSPRPSLWPSSSPSSSSSPTFTSSSFPSLVPSSPPSSTNSSSPSSSLSPTLSSPPSSSSSSPSSLPSFSTSPSSSPVPSLTPTITAHPTISAGPTISPSSPPTLSARPSLTSAPTPSPSTTAPVGSASPSITSRPTASSPPSASAVPSAAPSTAPSSPPSVSSAPTVEPPLEISGCTIGDCQAGYIPQGAVLEWKIWAAIAAPAFLCFLACAVVAVHFDKTCFPDTWKFIFRDGSACELYFLIVLAFLWGFTVYVCTSANSVGALQPNVFFSSWAGFLSVCLTYGVWRSGADKPSIVKQIRSHPRLTTWNWLCTFCFSLVTTLSVTDYFYMGKNDGTYHGKKLQNLTRRDWLIALLVPGMTTVWCLLAPLASHLTTRPGVRRWVRLMWRQIEGMCSLALVGIWSYALLEFTGVSSLVNGCNNTYLGVWGTFMCSIFTLGTWLRDNKDVTLAPGIVDMRGAFSVEETIRTEARR